MILLAHLHSLFSKMDNHHTHQNEETFSASLPAFESAISTSLIQFSLSTKPGSEILTLSWILQCLQLLPNMNKAFEKLISDLDYPMDRWEAPSVDEYLKVSLKLLDVLNSITSSVCHLGQARMSLSHALTLLEDSPSFAMEHLKAIQPVVSKKKWEEAANEVKLEEGKSSPGKEWVICQAIAIMKVVACWVCAVVESSLSGDVESCLKLKKTIDGFPNSSLMNLHTCVCEEMMAKGVLFEVREVNNGIAQLVAVANGEPSRDVAEELGRRVEILEKKLEDVTDEVNQIFSEVMLKRNNLLGDLRQRLQQK